MKEVCENDGDSGMMRLGRRMGPGSGLVCVGSEVERWIDGTESSPLDERRIARGLLLSDDEAGAETVEAAVMEAAEALLIVLLTLSSLVRSGRAMGLLVALLVLSGQLKSGRAEAGVFGHG